MKKEYGYCRISTPKQNIDRQERNILEFYPAANIVKEIYTGTKTIGRTERNGTNFTNWQSRNQQQEKNLPLSLILFQNVQKCNGRIYTL